MSEYSQERNQDQSKISVYESDVSITELLLIIWRYRYVGMIIASLPVIVAFVYALTVTPTYSSRVSMQPPLSRGVNELNVRVKSAHIYKSDQVFKYFVNNLYSYSLRKEFFKEQGLHEYFGTRRSFEESFLLDFDKDLIVIEPGKKDTVQFTKVNLTMDNAQKVADVLQKFISKVEAYTVGELVNNVDNSINKRLELLKEEIASKRKLMKERREDLIVILSEALRIAQKLGIKSPKDFNYLEQSRQAVADISVNTDKLPKYALGSIALSAEIEELKKRKSDDSYISGLRNMQEEIAFLEAIKIDSEKIQVMRIDQPAIVPEKRIKPNRRLIVIIGSVIGLVLGLIGIFIANFVSIMRREISRSEATV